MSTGKISASQVRTTAPTKQAAVAEKPKATAQAAQTQAAGWGAGAAKPQALKISAARIGEGPKTTDAVAVPKGFKAELKNFELKANDKVHGEALSIEQSTQQLSITTPAGKKVTIGAGPEGMKQFAEDWKSELSAAKKEPKPEWGLQNMNWFAEDGIRGAGTAGKLVSTMEGGSSYMGGAHPNNASILRTYDASTGKQVKLEDLFTQKQLNDLVNDIAAKLPKLSTEDGIEGSSFGDDKKFIREAINENFAVTADKSGKVKVEIAWESGIHALGGQMAHFTVDAPNDPAFRAKLGLE